MSTSDLKTIDPRMITFVYRNRKRKIERRFVIPESIEFKSVQGYYEEEQWLMNAFDVERQAQRTFSMLNILSTIETVKENMLEL